MKNKEAFVTMKTVQENVGDPVKKQLVHLQNADVFLRHGMIPATAEDKKKYEKVYGKIKRK